MNSRLVVGSVRYHPASLKAYLVTTAAFAQSYSFAALAEEMSKTYLPKLLWAEMQSIMQALKRMELTYAVALPRNPAKYINSAMVGVLSSRNECCVRLPTDIRHCTAFPRDIAVQLPDSSWLVSDNWKTFCTGKLPADVEKSRYGMGGEIHVVSDTAIVASHWLMHRQGNQIPFCEADTTILRSHGLRVGEIPLGVITKSKHGKLTGTAEPDTHVDRICAVVVDPKGRLHLVLPDHMCGIDPTLPQSKAMLAPAEMQERVQAVCQHLGMTLHVVRAREIPGSICLVQFPDGRVLMTYGEPELEGLLRDILGTDSVECTDRYILAYPIAVNAGIRCLVNYLPAWMCLPYMHP